MKPLMAKSSHFHWITNKVTNDNEEQREEEQKIKTTPRIPEKTPKVPEETSSNVPPRVPERLPSQRSKLQAIAVNRFRSVLTVFGMNRSQFPARVVGTLFGRRRGHVHFAFQRESGSEPVFLIELATPISGLVREMASGLVRIALECDKAASAPQRRIEEEPTWRTYCNGKRCGFANRRECGEKEWKVLRAVEMVSMGAGVLPGGAGDQKEQGKKHEDNEDDDEIMYMRAKFERVVGDKDSEAFYMMNPDSNGAPELSIYLLRI